MSSYAKTVNFAVKDGLASGDPAKVIKGTEIDTEFNNIATMSATKQDSLPISDSSTIVFNASDATKLLKFSLTGLTTGATRTLTIQDVSGTIAILSQPATFTTLGGTVITASTNVVTPIVTTGAASSMMLSTSGGQQVEIRHVASAVNPISLSGSATGTSPSIGPLNGSDTDIGMLIFTKGAGTITFAADSTSTNQFQILRTASATRNITVTGSNGGNPTISTTAGALALGNGQLQFPATQNPSADVNTLDDYEEGTWTASVGGTATYNGQAGTYTKVGRLVFVSCLISVNTIGTGSTTVISGLPFAVVSANGDMMSCRVAGSSTAIVSATALAVGGSSTIQIDSRTAASASDAANAIFANGTAVRITGCYHAAT